MTKHPQDISEEQVSLVVLGSPLIQSMIVIESPSMMILSILSSRIAHSTSVHAAQSSASGMDGLNNGEPLTASSLES